MGAGQDSHDGGDTGGDDVAPGLFAVGAVTVAVHDLQRTVEQPRILLNELGDALSEQVGQPVAGGPAWHRAQFVPRALDDAEEPYLNG